VWPVTWPLILYAISSAIARSLDAFLVAHYFDESVFAIFRYGAREFPLVASLAAGLSTVMIARLTQGDNVDELKARSTRLMHVCYPLIACLIVVSVPLFQIVFGESFRESALIFNLYLLLTLTQLVFPQTVFMAKGNTRLLWYVSLSELAVNVVASLLLLQQFGLIGIVWGTLIAFAYEKIVLFILLNKQYSIRLKELVDQKVLALYTLLLILAFFLSVWMFGL
jgi:O-antigen/teichoic acid export membrane protein